MGVIALNSIKRIKSNNKLLKEVSHIFWVIKWCYSSIKRSNKPYSKNHKSKQYADNHFQYRSLIALLEHIHYAVYKHCQCNHTSIAKMTHCHKCECNYNYRNIYSLSLWQIFTYRIYEYRQKYHTQWSCKITFNKQCKQIIRHKEPYKSNKCTKIWPIHFPAYYKP